MQQEAPLFNIYWGSSGSGKSKECLEKSQAYAEENDCTHLVAYSECQLMRLSGRLFRRHHSNISLVIDGYDDKNWCITTLISLLQPGGRVKAIWLNTLQDPTYWFTSYPEVSRLAKVHKIDQ